MNKKLTTYICEKPSQAADLAKYLGLKSTHRKKNHYLDASKGIAVIHARGHLFELATPEEYEPQLKKSWDIKLLPVFPDKYKSKLKGEFTVIFKTIVDVLKNTQTLVIATDADDEGELIAREIIEKAGYKGVIKRALYNATDKKSLDKAFGSLLDENATKKMAQKASLRRRTDWMIGMNLTMAMTTKLKSNKSLSKGSFPVGRVITALALIVDKIESEIKCFEPKKYYNVVATCKNKQGEVFEASLQFPDKFIDQSIDKCTNSKVAVAFANEIKGNKFLVKSVQSEEKSKSAPLPYDLASLQIEMGKFGIEPDETLAILQGLYDQPLSCVTYPRTDCRYLPTGMIGDVKLIVNHLNDLKQIKALELDTSKKAKCFNDNKVDIHHGIIPTLKPVSFRKLSEKQTLIYIAIASRFCQQFMADYKYLSNKSVLQSGAISLVSNSTSIVDLGWKKGELLADEGNNKDKDDNIVSLNKGEEVEIIKASVEEQTTKPPSRLTPATLIKAMKSPAKYVDDENIKKMLNEGDGIGTSATRSDIIKRAFQRNLIVKSGGSVKPGAIFSKNADFFADMNPGFTALMQRNFDLVISGKMSEKDFINQNENFVRHMVEKWQNT